MSASPVALPPVRVRFAPSPTGYLHIGGVRTALFNFLWSRKTGGTFVLRIEDTDQERSTEASRQVILDAMRWLGMSWDEGPEVGGPFGPYTQTERLSIYETHADRLISEGKAYRCTCTKEMLDAQREALKARDPKASFKYPGTCREANHGKGERHVVRFKTPTTGVVAYDDLVFGTITTPNAAQQDFVLVRADGIPLYNFGAVVDDVTMGITLVARGRDHMVNTPLQILLYEALGAAVPQFAHLPMMLAPSGEKLSKRHGAVSVAEYQNAGFSPTALLNYLVRFGWSFGDEEVFSMQDMIDKFDWARCNKSDGKFDQKKLAAINHEHLKHERLTPATEYVARVMPFLAARGVEASVEGVTVALPTIRERARTYVEAAEALDFYFREPLVFDEKAVAKFLIPEHAAMLEAMAELVEGVDVWSLPAIEKAFEGFLTERGVQVKDVAQPARVALTGRSVSPGLYETIHVLGETLGKATTVRRIRDGAARARAAVQASATP